MGEVWEARDHVIGRSVAVKLLPSQRGDSAGSERFFREARTAGALHHPGVVTVHDLGQDASDGSLFLVMEFLQGRDLGTLLLNDGVPPVDLAVAWAAQAAAALAAAHEAGVVHRDVKPANLMLTPAGRLVIVDFGIARFVEATNKSSKVMGTLAYMPPERFDGQPGDGRSDLYSLGCVLSELLTGQVPFRAGTPIAMMNAHVGRPPARPGETRRGIPAALDDLVVALLAKDPRDRPATAREVQQRLSTLATSNPVLTEPDLGAGRLAALPPATGIAQDAALHPAPHAPDRAVVGVRPPRGGAPGSGPYRTGDAAPETEGGDQDGAARDPEDGSPNQATSRRRFLRLAAGAVVTAGAGIGIATAVSRDRNRWPFHASGDVMDGAPVVADGVVYVGIGRTLYALDAISGARKWASSFSGGVSAISAIAGGTLYAASSDGSLYAVDAATGAVQWAYDTGGAIYRSVPVVADGVVYVGSSDLHLHAVDAARGNERWTYLVGGTQTLSPVVVDEVAFITADMPGVGLHAVDVASGTRKWVYPDTDRKFAASAAVADGVLYLGDGGGHFHAIDIASGTNTWESDLGPRAYFSTATVAEGVAYAGSDENGILYAINTATGVEKWAVALEPIQPGNTGCTPAVATGVVYAGTTKNFYAIDAVTGAKKWTFSADDTTSYGSPAVVNGVVYVGGGDDGNLYALDAATGRELT